MNAHDLDARIAEAVRVAASNAAPTWQPPVINDAAALARMIDHTLLKPDAVEEQVRTLCAEGLEYGFASVCVHATWVPLCVELLAGSDVMVCSVVGFPMGATLPAVKAYEVEQVAALGAQEVDMVMNVGRLRNGDHALVLRDIQAVVDAAHDNGLGAKVILETALLTDEEKIAACVICQAAGADFVKTATGFNGGGATVEDIALMRRVVGNNTGVKAAGGVRNATDALAMIAAGANRIGTSGGVKIVQEMAGMKVTESVAGDY